MNALESELFASKEQIEHLHGVVVDYEKSNFEMGRERDASEGKIERQLREAVEMADHLQIECGQYKEVLEWERHENQVSMTELEGEYVKIEGQLREAVGKLDDLQTKCDHNKQALEKDRGESQVSMNELEGEYLKIETKLCESVGKLDDLQVECDQYKVVLERERRENQVLMNELEGEYLKIETQLRESVGKLDYLQIECDQYKQVLEKDRGDNQASMIELEGEYFKIETQLRESVGKLDGLQVEYDQFKVVLEREREENQGSMKELEGEYGKVEIALKECVVERDVAREEKLRGEAEVRDCIVERDQAKEELHDVSLDRDRYMSDCESISSEMESVKSENSTLVDSNNEMSEAILLLKSFISEAKEKLSQAENKILELQDQIAIALSESNQFNDIKSRMSTLESENRDVTASSSSLTTRLMELEEEKDVVLADVDELTEDLEVLRAEKEGLVVKVDELSGRLVEVIDERDVARKDLECLGSENNLVSGEFNASKQELEALKSKFKELLEKRDVLEGKLSSQKSAAEEEMRVINESHCALEVCIAELQGTIETMEIEYAVERGSKEALNDAVLSQETLRAELRDAFEAAKREVEGKQKELDEVVREKNEIEILLADLRVEFKSMEELSGEREEGMASKLKEMGVLADERLGSGEGMKKELDGLISERDGLLITVESISKQLAETSLRESEGLRLSEASIQGLRDRVYELEGQKELVEEATAQLSPDNGENVKRLELINESLQADIQTIGGALQQAILRGKDLDEQLLDEIDANEAATERIEEARRTIESFNTTGKLSSPAIREVEELRKQLQAKSVELRNMVHALGMMKEKILVSEGYGDELLKAKMRIGQVEKELFAAKTSVISSNGSRYGVKGVNVE